MKVQRLLWGHGRRFEEEAGEGLLFRWKEQRQQQLRGQPEIRSRGSCRHAFSGENLELSEALPCPLDRVADTAWSVCRL